MKILKKEIEKSYLLIVGIISVLLLVGYYSYALFTLEAQEQKSIRIVTGSLKATLTSTDEAFTANKVTVGSKATKTLEITLTNQNGRDAKFNFYYETVSEGVTVQYLSDTKAIPPTDAGVVIKNGESETYSVEIKNTTGNSVTVTFGSDVGLYNKDLSFPSKGHVLEEKIVEPNPPELGDRLIPVVYEEKSQQWQVADTKTEKEWYDYTKQKWANAVIVDPTKYTETYEEAQAGEEVKMDDILQMYVWIPRYSYTIQGDYGKNGSSKALPGEIDVQFVGKDTKDSGTAEYTSGDPTEWYTPDAFTLGERNLSGIWVGKFESGYKGAENPTAAEQNKGEPQNVIIKPGVYSWRGISVSNIYNTAKGIAGNNAFGLSEEIYDSHAMKNDEWGAVAYLTQSKYGKYGNNDYQGANKEVYINDYYVSDSDGYKTGCSGGKPSASQSTNCTPYNNLESAGDGAGQKGPGASTTGNIYGVYDMAGGAWEYVMGNYSNEVGSSEFTENWATQYKDYINFYTNSAASTACSGSVCKSHALSETAGWYGDRQIMVTSSSPWFLRGGGYSNTTVAGVFYFDSNGGDGNDNRSFRVVLTLNKTA